MESTPITIDPSQAGMETISRESIDLLSPARKGVILRKQILKRARSWPLFQCKRPLSRYQICSWLTNCLPLLFFLLFSHVFLAARAHVL